MNKDLYKISFSDEKKWCRIDGVLLDEEEWLKRTGIPGELEAYSDDDKQIMFNDKIYTDTFCIGDIIPLISYFEGGTNEEYDMISNAGRGQIGHYLQERYVGRNGSFVLKNEIFENIKNTVIVPLSEFKTDFPKFNKQEYFKIMDSLNEYFNRN